MVLTRPRYRGSVYRMVPASNANPTDTRFSADVRFSPNGGRWNPPGTFEVLYTACHLDVCRLMYLKWLAGKGVDYDDLNPSQRRKVWELVADQSDLVDAVTDAGLLELGLRADYPRGVDHDATQPIGARLQSERRPGIECRSAVAPARQEIAIFSGNAPLPTVVAQLDDTVWWPAGLRTLPARSTQTELRTSSETVPQARSLRPGSSEDADEQRRPPLKEPPETEKA